MIKFIVDTTSSKTDVNGNRYHFATITSALTGKTLRVKSVGGDSNAVGLVRNIACAGWDEIHSTQSEMAIRPFRHARDFHLPGAKYEHEITLADFEAMETA